MPPENNEATLSPAKLIADLAAEQQARKALEIQLSERTEREQQLQAQVQQVQAIDPEKYQQLLKAQAQREEQDLLAQKDFERLKQRYQADTENAKKAADSWQQKHRQFLTETAIQEAFYQAGGKRPSSAEEAAPIALISAILAPKIQLIGNSVFLTELDVKGDPKSLSQKMTELRQGLLSELFNAESASNAAPMSGEYTREQARRGQAPIDAIAAGQVQVY